MGTNLLLGLDGLREDSHQLFDRRDEVKEAVIVDVDDGVIQSMIVANGYDLK